MATYRVWSGGDNTGGAGNTNWNQAYTTLENGLAAATASGDIILVEVSTTDIYTVNKTLFASNNISIIVVDKANSEALAVMGESTGYIGQSSGTGISLGLSSNTYKVYVRGLTLRIAGLTASLSVGFINGDGGHMETELCYIYNGSSNSTTFCSIGGAGISGANGYIQHRNLSIRSSHQNQYVQYSGMVEIYGLTFYGTAILTLFTARTSNNSGGASLYIEGMDASNVASNATIHSDNIRFSVEVKIVRSRLPSSYILLATQTLNTKGTTKIWALDCSSGDTNTNFHYADAFGSVQSDDSIKLTASEANQSWKITTNSNCTHLTPFITPWIQYYNANTSTSFTPRIEILRNNDSTSAYDNNMVWGEFSAKTTSGYTIATLYNDSMTVMGSPAAQATGAGTGAWSNGSGSQWSGKVDSGAAITCGEVGHVRGRVCVGGAITGKLHMDPVIRVT